MSRVFAYIIRTVGRGYRLTGSVPWVSRGNVFFGPCKKKMRPEVRPGDYIMGISGSGAGMPRRVLLWMQVSEVMTFADAYELGKKDRVFRSLRGPAIHVRRVNGVKFSPGVPECYEHIPGACHADDWHSDVMGNRDAFLVGGEDSWVAEAEGPQVTEFIVDFLREGITWAGTATPKNPLTENAIGKHVLLTGRTAKNLISWVPRLEEPMQSSRPRRSCVHTCSCR